MRMLRSGAVAVVFVFVSVAAFAQAGALGGTITDASGAVVSGAQITATNKMTGEKRTAQTSDSGAYSIPNLPVGTYQVLLEKSGFKPVLFDNVNISVAQIVPLNGKFEVGSVQETVTVAGTQEAPVETESTQLSNLVDQQRIKDLPLLTRNPYELVLLSPGTAQTNSVIGGITVNGARERNNNFMLDGVDNNDTSVPGILGGVLDANPESTQEFRVITNTFNAEFGRNTGAIVDVVTKSGTNEFHGNAYWFGRYNGFGGARDWFNRVGTPQDPYVRNQFGYSFGGPIRKNKTFFFFNEELQRFRTSLTNTATVPTTQFRSGVFTWNTVDPITGAPVSVPVDLRPGSSQNAFGLPVDPTIQKIFSLYPTPTQLNGDGISGQVFFPSASRQNSYQTVAKIDHHLTDKHTVSVRYGYDHFFDPNTSLSDILPGGVGAVAEKAIAQSVAANLTSTLSPTLVNDFRAGWNHIYAAFDCQDTSLLNSVSPVDQFGYGRDYLFNPFTSFGCLALTADSQFRKTGTTSFSDDLTWSHGNHLLKFGMDFRNVGESGTTNFSSRRQVDTRNATNFGVSVLQNITPTPTVALDDAASAFYGLVGKDLNAEFFNNAGARQPTDDKFFRQHEYDFYGQDTWKVLRNLTLNLGLRYQFNGVPYEEHANFSNLLSPPDTFPVVYSLVGPGTGHMLYNNDFSNIEPRVGFAFDPKGDGKMVIRGAFGIFHDRVFGNLFGNARSSPPFEQDYFQVPFETLNNAFGTGAFPGIPPNTTPSAIVPDGSGLQTDVFDTHFRNSSANNWDFGIQREIPGNILLDVNYVGTKGTHIYRQVDGNPPDPTLVNQLVAFCSDPTNSFGCTPATVSKANLFFGAENGVLPFDAVAHNALFQPFYIRSVGNSIYHGLQTKITRRMSHGLEVQGAYTYSHAIDDSGDPLVPAAGNRGFPRNSRALFEERGNSDNDIRHVAVINYLWQPPLGRGRSFLSNGVLGRVFEGFQFSGITSLQTGHPFDVFSTTDSERTGLSNRADIVGDPFAPGINSNPQNGLKPWFTNPLAFAQPPFGRAGSIGRNHFYGPGFVNFDLVLSKVMKLSERFGLETRIEGYNIFNHPHFTNPGADAQVEGNQLNTGIFGDITSTATRPDGTTSARQLQVAMKLTF